MATDDSPAVGIDRIENIEDADITVNRYSVDNGEVVEEEVSAEVTQDDIETITDEVATSIRMPFAHARPYKFVDSQ